MCPSYAALCCVCALSDYARVPAACAHHDGTFTSYGLPCASQKLCIYGICCTKFQDWVCQHMWEAVSNPLYGRLPDLGHPVQIYKNIVSGSLKLYLACLV